MKLGKSAKNHFDEGRQLLRQGKLREASERFRTGLKLDPSYKEGWMNLGVMLKDLGDYDEAEQCLRRAINLNRNYGDAWFNLGTLYSRALGRYGKSVEYFKEAMRCNPEDEDAVCFAAEALSRAGHAVEASELLDQAIEKHPNFTEALQMRQGLRKLGL